MLEDHLLVAFALIVLVVGLDANRRIRDDVWLFFLSKPFLDSRKCRRRLRLFGLAIRTIKDPNNLGARLLDHNPFLGGHRLKKEKTRTQLRNFFWRHHCEPSWPCPGCHFR